MNRFSRRSGASLKELMRRVDQAAADLNVLLVVIAIGLAALDVTFLFSQKVIDHLPPVTRVTYVEVPVAAK